MPRMDSMGWTHTDRNERRHHIGFRILSRRFALQKRSPTEPRFPPIQFQKESPREKEKAWRAETGRGRHGELVEPWAAFWFASPRKRSVRCGTKPPCAPRVRVSQHWC